MAAYTAAMALITVISVILASETYQGDITETRAEERRLIAEGRENPGRSKRSRYVSTPRVGRLASGVSPVGSDRVSRSC